MAQTATPTHRLTGTQTNRRTLWKVDIFNENLNGQDTGTVFHTDNYHA